jgi:hypothetical protein
VLHSLNIFILPLIDYCCVVWGNCSNKGLNRILKLQKRTARLILDQDPIAPSEPLNISKFLKEGRLLMIF